jgi:ABC-type branched-subunit amino acid transport system substrate-binding protein
VSELWNPMGSSDLSVEATKATSMNPDAVYLSEWSNPAILAGVTALYNIGYKGIIFAGSPVARTPLIQQMNGQGNGIYVGATLIEDTDVPNNEAYCVLHRQKIGNDINLVGMVAFETTDILIKGYAKAGTTTDQQKLDTAVRSLDYTLLSGDKLQISPAGWIERSRIYLAQIQNGALKKLEYVPLTGADLLGNPAQ